MTEQPNLLPCPNPWCEDNQLVIRWELYSRQVVCHSCGLKGPRSDTGPHGEASTMQDELDTQAIARWNTRANLAPTVKPLVWEETRYDTWEAKSSTGEYCVGFDDYWWAELNEGMGWEWVPDVDPRSFDGPYAAMQAAQTEHERRILSALTTAPVTPQQQARFVIDYLERETGVDFGDFIGMADAERIKAIAEEPTND